MKPIMTEERIRDALATTAPVIEEITGWPCDLAGLTTEVVPHASLRYSQRDICAKYRWQDSRLRIYSGYRADDASILTIAGHELTHRAQHLAHPEVFFRLSSYSPPEEAEDYLNLFAHVGLIEGHAYTMEPILQDALGINLTPERVPLVPRTLQFIRGVLGISDPINDSVENARVIYDSLYPRGGNTLVNTLFMGSEKEVMSMFGPPEFVGDFIGRYEYQFSEVKERGDRQ